jgi:hypothetical protein
MGRPRETVRTVSCRVWAMHEMTDAMHRLSSEEATYERVWRRPVDSTNVVFHFAGHLVRLRALIDGVVPYHFDV